jgi:putative ABC transport system permease protein
MEALVRDLRYALRGVRQNPGFAAIAVFTLALGIGATTAAYSVIAASLTARIPVRQIDRVVGLWSFDRTNGQSRVVVSIADFVAWQERQRSFEGLTAERCDGVNLSGIHQPGRFTREAGPPIGVRESARSRHRSSTA